MLTFNPENPFPLLPESSHTYAEAQQHAAEADCWLGLETARTEAQISARSHACAKPSEKETELWIDLPVKALLTPYTELRLLLDRLTPAPGATVVDLGAAYGRMAFVIDRHYPGVRFVGYEVVPERAREGQRCLKTRTRSSIELRIADLSAAEFSPVEAEYYFLYDYGSPTAIDKTLEDLRRIAQKRAITVVGRGRSSRHRIEKGHPWLSEVVPPRHFQHYSVYCSAETGVPRALI